MAANLIIGKSRTFICKINNLTIGNQSKLDEGLKTIANAQHQTVPLFKQTVDSFFNARISKHRCNELARTVRLITGTKPARQHNNLGLTNLLGKPGN
ncbi:hypothetical protein SDC9_87070 [bioreactor metagenome]|uniref:Uncharacterized protein n=1 Tax=bioreactor metagenome TaxID=1076179 RepID=A0A644ZHY2_9ZZZZ